MKHHASAWPVALASLCTLTPGVLAQTAAPEFLLDTSRNADAGARLNRFRVSYRLGFNVSAEFKNLGGFGGSMPGPATGGAVNRTYDNGYNRVDSSGNAGDTTWNWGYNSGSQIVGDTIVMNSSSAAGNLSSEADDGNQHGFELSYMRHLGTVGRGSWGLEGALGMGFLRLSDSNPLSDTVTDIADAFPLGGIVPPAPVYEGTFAGPGAVIGSIPTRTSATALATVAGQRSLDADIYALRLGPYIEFPLLERLTGGLSAGVAVAAVSSQFQFVETTTSPLNDPVTTSGDDATLDFLFGGYVGAHLSFELSPNVSVFTGLQYQHLGDLSQKANGKEATLDLGGTFFWSLGLGYSF